MKKAAGRFLYSLLLAGGILSGFFETGGFSEDSASPDFDLQKEMLASFEAGEYDAAIEDATTLLEEGADPALYHLRGKAYFIKGTNDLAITDFIRAQYLDPRNPVFTSDLAAAYFRKGYIDDAILYGRKTVELKPADPQALLRLGDYYFEKSALDPALAQYEKAMQIAPLDFQCHEAIGNVKLKQGAYKEAIRHYSRAIELGPTDPARSRIYASRKRAYSGKFFGEEKFSGWGY